MVTSEMQLSAVRRLLSTTMPDQPCALLTRALESDDVAAIDALVRDTYLDTHRRYIESRPGFSL